MNKGAILSEILLASALLSILIIVLIRLLLVGHESFALLSQETQAVALLQEQFEALRSVREDSWSNLNPGTYYLAKQSGSWQLVATTSGETVAQFTRSLSLEPVERNSSGQIVESGGTIDPSTKRALSTVTWEKFPGQPKQFQAITYLTRYLDNLVWTQTTQAEFATGTFDDFIVVTNALESGEKPEQAGAFRLANVCSSGNPQALIYDDQYRNGWRSDCTGLPFWQWLICVLLSFFSNSSINKSSTDYTYSGSQYSLKVTLNPPGSGTSWSWVRIYNFNAVCTQGFKYFHFYVYNPRPNQPIDFWVTVYQGQWESQHVTVPANPTGQWQEISLNYKDLTGSYTSGITSFFFARQLNASDPPLIFYLDQLELTGALAASGGYFSEGVYNSPVFDSGGQTAYNRIFFNTDNVPPADTQLGFQVAVSNSPAGPWEFYGPGCTTDPNDLYQNPIGEGLCFAHLIGRYVRYRAYLRSLTGVNTPTVYDVNLNYSP